MNFFLYYNILPLKEEQTMIRFQAIELSNFKNVSHGKIDFKDSANSSSVLGIYGQNGSGKTSVVEALQCIQKLFCCERLDEQFTGYIGIV